MSTANIKIGKNKENGIEYLYAKSSRNPNRYYKFKYTPNNITPPKGHVLFVDYNGDLIEDWPYASLASKSALPDNPSHTELRLVSQGWNWDLNDIMEYMRNYPDAYLTVGQMYDSLSQYTELDIVLTEATGLTIELSDSTNVDWGDGTTGGTSHTYSDYGNYMITIKGYHGSYTIKGDNRLRVVACRIGSKMYLGNYQFYYGLPNATMITFAYGMRGSSGWNTFGGGGACKALIFPKGFSWSDHYSFRYFGAANYLSIPKSWTYFPTDVFSGIGAKYVAIPHGGTSVAGFQGSAVKYINIPTTVTTLYGGFLKNCGNLLEVNLPNVTTVIGGSGTDFNAACIYNCASLRTVKAPKLNTFSSSASGRYAFTNCPRIETLEVNCTTSERSIDMSSIERITYGEAYTSVSFPTTLRLKEVILPETCTSLSCGGGTCGLEYLYVPKACATINGNIFYACTKLREINFTDFTSVPVLTSVPSIIYDYKIVVPDNLYDEWILATNWVALTSNIYKASES